MLTDIELMQRIGSHLAGKSITITGGSQMPLDKFLHQVAEIRLEGIKDKPFVMQGTKAFVSVTDANKSYIASRLVNAWRRQAQRSAGDNASDNELLEALQRWQDR